ncbi:MAG: ankyrin repeat-containing domain protein, partial [Piptocephalis tieghemiana]
RFLEAVQLGALGTVQRLASQVHDPMIPRNLRIVNPSDGWTTLMYAVLSGSFMMVRWILDQGHDTPDRPSCSYDRRTVLHLVAELGHEDILQLYLQRFPQLLEAKDRSGRTPLLVASRYGHEGLVEALLALDALVDAVDVEGNTALHYASAWGHLPIIRLLILHGCKYSMRNTAGWSASDWAFSPATRSVLEE